MSEDFSMEEIKEFHEQDLCVDDCPICEQKEKELRKAEEKRTILSFLQKVIESDDPFLVETLIDEIRFGTPERLTAFIEKVEGGG